MKPKYSIIIPTRNEEEAIAKILCSIPKSIEKVSEIIVVDSSKDITSTIAERLGAKVLRLNKIGKGLAMKKAVEISKGKMLIFLDGDGTDPPEYIPKLLKEIENADLVLGCRASFKSFENEDLLYRRMFEVYGILIRPLFSIIGFKTSDPLAGFRVIRKKDWDRLNLRSSGFEIEAEMNVKAVEKGFRIKEVAIPHLRRGGGLTSSKLAPNPKLWFKIFNVVIVHIKDKKLKKELIKFRKSLQF